MIDSPTSPSPVPLVDVRGLLTDLNMWSEKPSDTPVRPSRASHTYPPPVQVRGDGVGDGQYTLPLSVSPDNHSNSPFSSPLAGESFLLSQDESRPSKIDPLKKEPLKIDPLERQRQASAENIAALGEFSRLVQGSSSSEKREGGQQREGVSNRDGGNNRDGANNGGGINREGVSNREGSVRGGIDEKKDAGSSTSTHLHPSKKEEAVEAAHRVESAVTTFLHTHPEERDHLRHVQSSLGPSAAVDRMLALQHENER